MTVEGLDQLAIASPPPTASRPLGHSVVGTPVRAVSGCVLLRTRGVGRERDGCLLVVAKPERVGASFAWAPLRYVNVVEVAEVLDEMITPCESFVPNP